MGAGLAALAIETRRLYTDLLRRSEFDLLTDIQNRFSLEKHLDALIERARETAGIFGLIYIDLDGFKLVNDRYGHQVGDLYLQEAAARMKHQLRPGDILARLGGDDSPSWSRRCEAAQMCRRSLCGWNDASTSGHLQSQGFIAWLRQRGHRSLSRGRRQPGMRC